MRKIYVVFVKDFKLEILQSTHHFLSASVCPTRSYSLVLLSICYLLEREKCSFSMPQEAYYEKKCIKYPLTSGIINKVHVPRKTWSYACNKFLCCLILVNTNSGVMTRKKRDAPLLGDNCSARKRLLNQPVVI